MPPNENKRDSAADGPRRRTLKTIAATVAVLTAIPVAGVLAFVYSGSFDVTATTPHWEITHRLLLALREQSIKSQARDVKVPELDDPAKVHAGFQNFHSMCVACHNAPGAAPTEISKGLYPEAPNLAQSVRSRTAGELYMIIKHGIKMSGMPAWEPSHSGDEIWSMVAFLRTLPNMSDDEYQAAVEYYEAAGKGGMRH